MKRNKLLKLLQAYQPSYTEEILFKKSMINFIRRHPDCFERTLITGHITASAWLLNQDYSQALLMHHNKLDRWFQLGGHCDGDHDVLAVAIKEAQEESGVTEITPVNINIFDIDIHLIPDTPKEKAHYHYDVRFLLNVISNEQIKQNSESKELRWITKNIQTLPTDNPSVVRMFHKWLSLKDLNSF